MGNSYEVIEIENYFILKTLQKIHFGQYSIFIYHVGLKHVEPHIGKVLKRNIILITKYLNLNWNVVNNFNFYQING